MSTNINCSLNCIYQVDGKCTLDYISSFSGSINDSCMYFYEKKSTKKDSKKHAN